MTSSSSNTNTPFSSYAGMSWTGFSLRKSVSNSTLIPASAPMMAYSGAYNNPYTEKQNPIMTTHLSDSEPFTQIYLEGLSFACTRTFSQIATPCTLNITGWGMNQPGIAAAAPFTQFTDYSPRRDPVTHSTTMQALNLVDLDHVSDTWGINAMSFNAEAPDGSPVDLYLDNISYTTATDGACCQGPGNCSC